MVSRRGLIQEVKNLKCFLIDRCFENILLLFLSLGVVAIPERELQARVHKEV